MGRARSTVAARTSIDKLLNVVFDAYNVEHDGEKQVFDEFPDAVDFCRPHCEELGGEAGHDGWYIWAVGEWVVISDLGALLHRNESALEALSSQLGEVITCCIDVYVEYAAFAAYADGRLKRRLVLEDDEILEEGLPVKVEQGRQRVDFSEEEAERIWTAYGLPTFEHDPIEGPWHCVAVVRKD